MMAGDSDVFSLKGNTRLYDVLGVSKTATDDAIKRAYRKLAVACHPDKNPDGVERFKQINFAHTVLSDTEQRRMYDANTLRAHIEGTVSKERDPAMDPNHELSPDDLRSFVERLHGEHVAADRRRHEFEEKRSLEAQRRAEFDRRVPDFKMPELRPVAADSSHREELQQFRRTADLVAAMHRAEEKAMSAPATVLDQLVAEGGGRVGGRPSRPVTYDTATTVLRGSDEPLRPTLQPDSTSARDGYGYPAAGHQRPPAASAERSPPSLSAEAPAQPAETAAGAAVPAPVSPVGGPAPRHSESVSAPDSLKEQMMRRFRAERAASGVAPTAQPKGHREVLASSQHSFVRDGAQPAYEPSADEHRKRSNFDYKTFVQAKYTDGGVLGEAIMADALKEYGPEK